MALTFEPQPIAVLRPELRPAVLTHIGLKTQLIERLGVDELLVVPFTKAFSRIRRSASPRCLSRRRWAPRRW